MVLMMRKSTIFLAGIAAGCLVLAGLLLLHPQLRKADYEIHLAKCQQLVRQLQLTDLCLFTEARYTRHLSQADLHSPFQDFPMSFDHFPSGSMVMPPGYLTKGD
jgi:hypothetical protein